jgi:hypothetical protein
MLSGSLIGSHPSVTESVSFWRSLLRHETAHSSANHPSRSKVDAP